MAQRQELKSAGPDAATAIRFAQFLNRTATFGMPQEFRRDQLAETHADWDAMSHDQPVWRLVARAVVGFPVWVWVRMANGATTTIPSAAVMFLLALGALLTATVDSPYPARTRAFMLVVGAGALLVSISLIRSPQRIVIRSLGWPAVAIGIGFIGVASNLPAISDWNYETPVIESWMTYELLMAGLHAVGIGALLCGTAAFASARRLATIGGGVVLIGAGLIAVSQFTWGIWVLPVDVGMGLSAVFVGFVTLSWVHVLPRLRRLEIE